MYKRARIQQNCADLRNLLSTIKYSLKSKRWQRNNKKRSLLKLTPNFGVCSIECGFDIFFHRKTKEIPLNGIIWNNFQ